MLKSNRKSDYVQRRAHASSLTCTLIHFEKRKKMVEWLPKAMCNERGIKNNLYEVRVSGRGRGRTGKGGPGGIQGRGGGGGAGGHVGVGLRACNICTVFF